MLEHCRVFLTQTRRRLSRSQQEQLFQRAATTGIATESRSRDREGVVGAPAPRRPRLVSGVVLLLPMVVVLGAIHLGADESVAGLAPENVAVVINANSQASMAVANEFIRLRDIPAMRVVYLDLPDASDPQVIDVDVFRRDILTPVLTTLAQRGVIDRIDCVAYSAGIPYAVRLRADVGEAKLAKTATLIGSTNGLTYLHELVQTRDLRYLNPRINGYACRPTRSEPKAAALTEDQRTALGRADRLMDSEKWAEADDVLTDLLNSTTHRGSVQYRLASCLTQLGRREEATILLKLAVRNGWTDANTMAADPRLEPLRSRPGYRAILVDLGRAAWRGGPVRPTLGFSSRRPWNPDRTRTRTGKGQRYMLSVMLAVVGERGNSVSEAITCLRRSAAADGSKPTGTVYYMVNNDIRSKVRQWGFDAAIDDLHTLGVQARRLRGVLPRQRADVAGLMAGSASFDWPGTRSGILPGAICEHLTSTGGVMRSGGSQTPLSVFIRHGAAGASGAVTEPYAIAAKFPSPFIHSHYARGSTLAEAFYQSVLSPYQLLIVGDPLCRPWATIPRVTVNGFAAGAVLTSPTPIAPAATEAVSRYELYVDGRWIADCPEGETVMLPVDRLPEGRHELSVVAVADHALETRGRRVTPFYVHRGEYALEVEFEGDQPVTLGEPITLRASAPGVDRIAFSHNGRVLGSISGSRGQVRIDSALIGAGRVRIESTAYVSADAEQPVVLGRPIDVTISSQE